MWIIMKSILLFCVLLQLGNEVTCRPGIEVERQRLLELPNHHARFQSAHESTPETKRILDEIHRINVQLGYIKRPADVRPRLSVDGYFYPRPPYHPLNQRHLFDDVDQTALSARPTEYNSGLVLRQITHKHSEVMPRLTQPDLFYYPAPYLQVPNEWAARQFATDERGQRQMAINNDVTTIVEYAPGYFDVKNSGAIKTNEDLSREKSNLIRTVKKIVTEMNASGTADQRPEDNAVLIEKQHKENDALNIVVVSPMKLDGIEVGRSTALKTNDPSKTFFRPSKTTSTKVTAAPSPIRVATPAPVLPQKATKADVDPEMAKDPEGQFKGPFSNFINAQKEQVVEALKTGGVIIQRLRVRNGGIAIAGPNGVATAGSGGTAIVGPGGIALTHPRSLTIAGPGARVYAVPETTDLQELALRSSGRDLSLDGVVVATGPVVYYNPETPLSSKVEHRSGADEELISLPFYGGAKGQVLQISRKTDGTVTSEVVKQIENTIRDYQVPDMSSFQVNLANIQRAASQLVMLQQNIKMSGRLTDADHKSYSENLAKLGVSAQNLAHIQQAGGQDDFRLLFEGPLGFGELGEKVDAQPDKEKPDEEDDNVGEEDGSSTSSTTKPDTDDSVQVSIPDKDASVAEAKPVGLAIAGEGGVASSKPIATAVVGPGGLAVARPIATAIAGISPSEVSALGIPIGSGGQKFKSFLRETSQVYLPGSKKYGLAPATEFDRAILVGPGFVHESRINDKDIKATEDTGMKVIISTDGIDAVDQQESAEVDESIGTERPQDNELLPPVLQSAEHALTAAQPNEPIDGVGAQYPFIPPVSPFRFNWNTEPLEPSPGYEPIPFFDHRAYSYPQFYPFPSVLPINPFHYQQNRF